MTPGAVGWHAQFDGLAGVPRKAVEGHTRAGLVYARRAAEVFFQVPNRLRDPDHRPRRPADQGVLVDGVALLVDQGDDMDAAWTPGCHLSSMASTASMVLNVAE